MVAVSLKVGGAWRRQNRRKAEGASGPKRVESWLQRRAWGGSGNFDDNARRLVERTGGLGGLGASPRRLEDVDGLVDFGLGDAFTRGDNPRLVTLRSPPPPQVPDEK